MKKTNYIEIRGKIRCLSGVRVGGSDELLQTGGTDLTCIKHPVTLEPYLPGSSLKGRMRSESEQRQGLNKHNNSEPCTCGTCMVCRVFGTHKNKAQRLGPSRLIVRDCLLLDGGETELKPENVIDRVTGAALHPRKVERVVAGSVFSVKLAIQVWDLDANGEKAASHTSLAGKPSQGIDALKEFVFDALRMVQRTGIGSGLSKGSGEIEFFDLEIRTDDGEWEKFSL